MTPAKLASQGDRPGDDPGASRTSFHGRLLERSATTLPAPRNGRVPFKFKFKWPAWPGRLAGLGPIVGQGAIFAGGLAIGGGVMLLRRGEPLQARPGTMLVAGVAFVTVSILSKVLARGWPRSATSAARG